MTFFVDIGLIAACKILELTAAGTGVLVTVTERQRARHNKGCTTSPSPRGTKRTVTEHQVRHGNDGTTDDGSGRDGASTGSLSPPAGLFRPRTCGFAVLPRRQQLRHLVGGVSLTKRGGAFLTLGANHVSNDCSGPGVPDIGVCMTYDQNIKRSAYSIITN